MKQSIASYQVQFLEKFEVVIKNSVQSNTCAGELLNTISALLLIAKIEAGKAKPDEQPICICEWLRERIALHEPKAKEIVTSIDSPQGEKTEPALTEKHRNISLLFERGDFPEEVVLFDPTLLQIVFNNLLSNAIKFTRDGSKVSVRIQKEGKMIKISVSDE